MRLIDADALIEDINSFWDWDSIDGITSTTVLKQTITDISHAPTIDAVPVVNCINCTQMEIQSETISRHTTGCCFCKKWKSFVSPVGFCNFGERRNDE